MYHAGITGSTHDSVTSVGALAHDPGVPRARPPRRSRLGEPVRDRQRPRGRPRGTIPAPPADHDSLRAAGDRVLDASGRRERPQRRDRMSRVRRRGARGRRPTGARRRCGWPGAGRRCPRGGGHCRTGNASERGSAVTARRRRRSGSDAPARSTPRSTRARTDGRRPTGCRQPERAESRTSRPSTPKPVWPITVAVSPSGVPGRTDEPDRELLRLGARTRPSRAAAPAQAQPRGRSTPGWSSTSRPGRRDVSTATATTTSASRTSSTRTLRRRRAGSPSAERLIQPSTMSTRKSTVLATIARP